MRKCKCGSLKVRTKGMCNSCFQKWYRSIPENMERIKKQKSEWYLKNKDLNVMKLKREQKHFSGMREQVLERDGYKCVCGNTKMLIVHHKDGEGRNSSSPNNSLENLITLCKKCHLDIHRNEIFNSRRLRKLGFWSKTYKQCKECGTTKRRHNGKGLCFTCYARFSKRGMI